MPPVEVVITGIGVVSPIGIGKECVWDRLCAGVSGVSRCSMLEKAGFPVQVAAEVKDFDSRAYVKNRKSLKVMARDSQLGVAAAALACRDAGVQEGIVDPERLGVILGADRICNSLDESEAIYGPCMQDDRFDFTRWASHGMARTFPLGFLRVLPNMIASHVSIDHDARGPNNTIHQAETSSLLAILEGARIIERGAADAMIAGGASSQMTPYDWVGHCVGDRMSRRQDDPARISRPFDAHRSGEVRGEGAAAFLLERRDHAQSRGAKILARLLGGASASEPCNGSLPHATALQRCIRLAMGEAGIRPQQVGHVNAHAGGLVREDEIEARALHATLPDVPVTAPKSLFGNLGAAGGAVELVASVLALAEGRVPATLNYEHPDPCCPVPVIRGKPLATAMPAAVVVNWTRIGQSVALVLGKDA